MNRIAIVSDSSHDLSEEYIDRNNIKIARFFVSLDGENYFRDGVDITRSEFYRLLRENPKIFPKTSLPSVADYRDIFKYEASKGRDILCFTVSSNLSGSYQSARLAADIIREDFPKNKIYVVDSQSASLGLGILLKKAVRLRKKGLDIEKIYNIISDILKTGEIYICLETLDYLEKGGRLGKLGLFAGRLLNIKPLVSFKDNKLSFETAVRGRKRAIRGILNFLDKKIGKNPSGYEVFVVHGDEEGLAEEVKSYIEDRYGVDMDFEPRLVSTAIISHIGPGAIAIGVMKK